jgi:hypothetical protein
VPKTNKRQNKNKLDFGSSFYFNATISVCRSQIINTNWREIQASTLEEEV